MKDERGFQASRKGKAAVKSKKTGQIVNQCGAYGGQRRKK